MENHKDLGRLAIGLFVMSLFCAIAASIITTSLQLWFGFMSPLSGIGGTIATIAWSAQHFDN